MTILFRTKKEYIHSLDRGAILWVRPEGFTILKFPIAKTCQNCNQTINFPSIIVKFKRFKVCKLDFIKAPRTAHCLCESCGNMYFNLAKHGFYFDYAETFKAFAEFNKIEQEYLTEIRRANLITKY